MNRSYEILEDKVLVTTDKDKRSMPKYANTEEILELENEIELIENLIESKSREIDKFRNKKLVIHHEKISKASSTFLFSALGFAVAVYVLMITSAILSLPIAEKFLLMPPAVMLVGAPLVILSDKSSKTCKHIIGLQSDILNLIEVKFYKENRVKELKKKQGLVGEQAETKVKNKRRTEIEKLREVEKIISSMDRNASKITIDAIADAVEQVEAEKQKVLTY